MTFDEALSAWVRPPFDVEYLWLDMGWKNDTGARRIKFAIVSNSGYFLYQVIVVGPGTKAKEVQEALQHNPWCRRALNVPVHAEPDHVEPDHEWHTGTVQDVIHYVKQRARL